MATLRRLWHVYDGMPLVDRLPKAGRILDVGAGRGDQVSLLQSLGYDATGVEPNRLPAEAAQEAGIPVLRGTVFAPDLPGCSFDSVVLSQGIEHLQEPANVLARIRQLLTRRGQLVIATPNASGLPLRVFGENWAHWHIPCHVYLYGPRQPERLLAASGFRVSRTFTVTPSYWISMSLKLAVLPSGSQQPPMLVRMAGAPGLRLVDAARQGDCLVAVAAPA